jgi:hypothetical protein
VLSDSFLVLSELKDPNDFSLPTAFYSQILTHTKITLLNVYDDHHGIK